ncbi:cadherin domain-containing protein [uncultured Sunxiuqinia sp.]|uniref:cadherin domain-containing protein n=1 Tax=uncultured Sunxiuqinia sp. TaxID=1573825 RepID=UPI002632D365|nr:cadherin domain-containing protein [uncultured Sunxiuqinia sp.]
MKREMRDLILIIFLLLPASLIAQNSYYVSSSEGNDSNAGTSAGQAWKSLAKVNSFRPSAGDQILFKRGDEWVGTLTPSTSGSAGSPITYGAYGTGEKPKIYGSQEITGWTVHSGNIYKAKVNGPVNQLFVDGSKIPFSRYPKHGWATISSTSGSTQFTSNTLSSSINYSGSHLIIKTVPWFVDGKEVVASSGQTLTLNAAPTYNTKVGNGFVLVNSLSLLTQPGEWHYDASTKTVYLWTPSGDSPANHQVKVSTLDNGIYIDNKNYITLQDLSILQQKVNGILSTGGISLTVNNCDVSYAHNRGIYVMNGSNGNYTNNMVRNSYYEGMHIASSNSTITDNQLFEILSEDDFGAETGNEKGGPGRGIASKGANNTVKYNRLMDMGYVGISFSGENNLIEYNYINGACQILDDGGAIYTYNGYDYSQLGAAGTKIKSNIVLNVIGESHTAYGIYMDNNTHDILIEDNTVSNTNCAIYLHQNGKITVDGNTIMDATLLLLNQDEVENSTITNNTFYATARQGSFIWFKNAFQRMIFEENATGLFDNNRYVGHYGQNVFRYQGDKTLADWKRLRGVDANSTGDFSPLADGEVEELFYNDTKQTKAISLGSSLYRDLDGNEVSGSISLAPFTSKILIRTKGTATEKDNQTPVIQDQSFEINGSKAANEPIGQIMASDPDTDQTLTYTIVDGNAGNMFALDPSTGLLTANSDINATVDQTILLTVQVMDNASTPLAARAQVSIQINAQDIAPAPDAIAPTIASFVVPASYSTLTVPVSEFTANDNTAVTGFLITETATSPAATASGWLASAPVSYTLSEVGSHTLYAWAKDAAGNVSASKSQAVNIQLPDLSPTYSEYLFEEASGKIAIDSHDSNDGTIINEELRVDGINGGGLQLTGTGYITMGNSFGANVQDELTLSAWILPQSSSNIYQGVIMHGGPSTDSYALYIHPGLQSISFKTSGTTNAWMNINDVAELWDGNWHLVTVTYDGTQKVLYLDDKVLLSIDATGTIESGEGYNLLVGAGRDEENPSLLYEGLMDEVRIYNSALTGDEVNDLYNRNNTALNQMPVIQSQSFEINEPKNANDIIGQLQASDPDDGQTLSFAITAGNAEGLFSIDPATGEIIANANIPASEDQVYTLEVKVTDNHPEPLSATASVTITIHSSQVNQAPVAQNLLVNVEGNIVVNDLIGKIIASDPNEGQQLNYRIVQGNEAGLFSINQATGEILAAVDYLTTTDQSIVLGIEVKDNASEPLAINVTATINILGISLNHSPVIDDQMVEIPTDIVSNDLILEVIATDPDAGDQLTYSIVQGNEAGLFRIDPKTGEIFANTTIEKDRDQTFSLIVQVTDDASNSLSAQANITIISLKIAAINQSPVAQNLNVQLEGNIKVNDLIGEVLASDPDEGQQLSYRIVEGNANGLFSIDETSGVIVAAADILTTSDQTIILTVEVKDNASTPLSATAQVTIQITGVQLNQSPVVHDQSFELRKNNKVGDLIGQIIATDPDPEQQLTFSILSGNEEGIFAINPQTGEIYIANAFEATTSETINLLVVVTDNGSIPLTANANITIQVIINGKIVKGEVNPNKPNRVILSYSETIKSENLKNEQIHSDFIFSDGRSVQKITVNNNEIYLDLDSDYQYDDEIIVSYSRGATPILDIAGNELESFDNYFVVNNLQMDSGIGGDLDPTADALKASVYPNPSDGQINIKAENLSGDDCEVFVFSMTGNLVIKKLLAASFGSMEEKLNLSQLRKGTYIIKLVSKRQTFQDKIVIM